MSKNKTLSAAKSAKNDFRAILDFELSNKTDSALLPDSVVTDEKKFMQ